MLAPTAEVLRLSSTRRSGLTVWLYRWPLNCAAGAGAPVADQVRQAVKADNHNDNDRDDRTDNGEAVVLTKPEPGRRSGISARGSFSTAIKASCSTFLSTAP